MSTEDEVERGPTICGSKVGENAPLSSHRRARLLRDPLVRPDPATRRRRSALATGMGRVHENDKSLGRHSLERAAQPYPRSFGGLGELRARADAALDVGASWQARADSYLRSAAVGEERASEHPPQ